ncbi:tunicamycin resistance protein [Chytridiales sp. JEL 0842]|nr:tunicamycin resistance protein [Chytridiales sp. JEL 0842]
MTGFLRNVGLPIIPLTIAISLIHNPIAVSVCFSVLAGYLTWWFIPLVKDVFVRHGRSGKDLLKKDMPIIPESTGVIAGAIYIGIIFLFIPVPFVNFFKPEAISGVPTGQPIPSFPHDKLAQYLSAILSILSMLLLGFLDDVLDIRWRVKIWMPFIASIPLLTVYYVTCNVTHVVLPSFIRPWFGAKILDLGVFYYMYMSALCVFSTNAINIIAGVNGVEGGQSVVIVLSILANNVIQMLHPRYQTTMESHSLSFYFLMPLLGVLVGYMVHNWFPAKVFGGDTLVYFVGMTVAVAGISGHFTKTLLLFMVPQMFNFLYSCPQLFGFVECPRHRMPLLNKGTGLVEASRVDLRKERGKTKPLGRWMVWILEMLRLADVKRDKKTGEMLDVNNLTLINLVIVKGGPVREDVVTMRVMGVQVVCSLLAFGMRYGLAFLLYPEDRR